MAAYIFSPDTFGNLRNEFARNNAYVNDVFPEFMFKKSVVWDIAEHFGKLVVGVTGYYNEAYDALMKNALMGQPEFKS